MEVAESPLDVLSRAATMVQDGLPITTDETSKQTTTKQLPTTKWKRERRSSRLAEYSRKSDPKLPENTPPELLLSSSNSNQSISSVSSDSSLESQKQTTTTATTTTTSSNNTINNITTTTNGFGSKITLKNTKNLLTSTSNSLIVDTPLDMSVRQRGLPPSYAQTISNPDYRSGFRPTVITQSNNTGCVPDAGRYISKNESKSISMCDPIIDEHFRRSLGKDYAILFSNNNLTTTTADNTKTKSVTNNICRTSLSLKTTKNNTTITIPRTTTPTTPTTDSHGIIESFKEMMDTDAASLSVDDHFAKALGETWIKLNSKQKEKENNEVKNDNKKSTIRVLSI